MFEDGISNFKWFVLPIEVSFPIDEKGQLHGCCKFCRLYIHGKCAITGYAPVNYERNVAYDCPVLKLTETEKE